MRAVVQRVRRGAVFVEGQTVGAIERGLVVLLGVSADDAVADGVYLAEKIVNLRIFDDDAGKMNLSLIDIQGGVLSVSQFTLYGDCRKGRRPNFTAAARPEQAQLIYEAFNRELAKDGLTVATGVFGADMTVEIINDGPVTILLDSGRAF